jgi:DNA polymerase-1
MERLLCVDFSNLIVRHHANPHGSATDALGRSANGAVGSLNQVLRTISERSPSHLLLGQDGRRADSHRRARYAGYKAHRAETNDDLVRQFQMAYVGAGILGLPVLADPGHEADDVIASAATQFDGEVEILTGDKDMLALCSDRITVMLLRPGGVLLLNKRGCYDIMGVMPEQVRDYKALVGDTSDGIPGVAGVGKKSAERLLTEYGTLQGIYEALESGKKPDHVSQAICNKILEGRNQAELSGDLAELVCDLNVNFGDLICPTVFDDNLLGNNLTDAGLHSLRDRIRPRTKKPAPPREVSLDEVIGAMFNKENN